MDESELDDSYEEKWVREVAALESLPFVKDGSVNFVASDESANLNKVHVTVLCCWEQSRRAFKQLTMSCDNKGKPTHLDALRALRAKVEAEHGAPNHVGDSKAHERRLELERENMGVSRPKTAFDMLALGNAAVKRALEKARVDEEHARAACEAELIASNAREKAQREANTSKARAQELSKPTLVKQKRQKTSVDVHLSSCGRSCDSDTAQTEGETDDEPSWMTWTIARWRKHESEMQKRRSTQIRVDDEDKSLLRTGDDRQGWRWHWRRGMVGSVQDWANGSRFRVAFMLSELAIYFKVESEVAERLGFKLSAEQVKQAKVDGYIVDRTIAALHQLKQCRTEEERQDYGTVLAAVAPTREAKGDAQGMIAAARQKT